VRFELAQGFAHWPCLFFFFFCHVKLSYFTRDDVSITNVDALPFSVVARSKTTATLEPETTQHNSLDRLQIRK